MPYREYLEGGISSSRFFQKGPRLLRGGELICSGRHGGRATPIGIQTGRPIETNPATCRQPRGGDSQVNLRVGAPGSRIGAKTLVFFATAGLISRLCSSSPTHHASGCARAGRFPRKFRYARHQPRAVAGRRESGSAPVPPLAVPAAEGEDPWRYGAVWLFVVRSRASGAHVSEDRDVQP